MAVQRYSYTAITLHWLIALLLASGVGIPIGEELVNVPAGILVGQGSMPALPVFVAAYLGVLAGDYLWFSICRFFGKRLLRTRRTRRFFHPRRLLEAKYQFDRRGAWMLVLARFIPGSRSPALTVAAFMHMPWKKFTLVELTCVAITTPIQVLIGILIGRELADASLKTTIFTGLAVVAVIITVTAIAKWWMMSRKQSGPKPRARMQWLRVQTSNSTATSRHNGTG